MVSEGMEWFRTPGSKLFDSKHQKIMLRQCNCDRNDKTLSMEKTVLNEKPLPEKTLRRKTFLNQTGKTLKGISKGF